MITKTDLIILYIKEIYPRINSITTQQLLTRIIKFIELLHNLKNNNTMQEKIILSDTRDYLIYNKHEIEQKYEQVKHK